MTFYIVKENRQKIIFLLEYVDKQYFFNDFLFWHLISNTSQNYYV